MQQPTEKPLKKCSDDLVHACTVKKGLTCLLDYYMQS